MNRGESGRRWLLPVLLTAYAVMIHWVYEVKIAPVFYYLGSRYRDPDPINYGFVFLLVLVAGALLPRTLTKASDFVLWMLYLMTCVPAALVPQYADIISRDDAFVLALFVVANYALVIAGVRMGPKASSFHIPVRRDIFWTGAALVTAVVFAYIFVTTGLSLTFISDFNDTRDIRFGYRDAIAGAGGPALGYLIQLQGNVINPLLIAKGALDRKWWLVGVGVLGQALIFSQTGYKMILLSPIAVPVIAYFLNGRERRGRLLIVGLLISSALSVVADQLSGALVWTAVLVDRLLIAPGTLTAAHVLVFDGQEKALWAYSFMSPFVDNPYPTTPAFMVGAQMTGNPQVTANANFFADGYANLGYVGITIEAVALVLILWALDAATRRVPFPLVAAMCLIPTLSLVNSGVFTSLLTGGFLFVILAGAALNARQADSVSVSAPESVSA